MSTSISTWLRRVPLRICVGKWPICPPMWRAFWCAMSRLSDQPSLQLPDAVSALVKEFSHLRSHADSPFDKAELMEVWDELTVRSCLL